MVQHMQINKHYTPHWQSDKQESHDISIGAEKAFDKSQHSPMIKKIWRYEEFRHGRNMSQHIMCNKTAASIILNEEIWKLSKMWHKIGLFTLTFLQNSSRSPTQQDQRRQRKEVKLSLFPGDMVLCTEDPPNSMRVIRIYKWFQQSCKIKIWVVLSYANREASEIKIKKAIPFKMLQN